MARPACASIIFNFPSCLSTPKPVPHQSKHENQRQNYLLKKITSFSNFYSDKESHKKYDNLVTSQQEGKF